MTAQGGASRTTRYRELDALRGFAAIGIVLWHYQAHFHATPLRHLLEPFYRAGYYSVDFFFVLSGVVLAKAYGTEQRRRDFSGNLVRRLARIYPLHLATLAAAAFLQFVLVGVLEDLPFQFPHNDLYHFVLNLTLSNFVGFEQGFSFNAPAWSISTEFYANVLFFVLIFFFRRLDRVAAALVVVSGFLIATQGDGRLEQTGTLFYVQMSLIRTVFGFFTGVLLYHWVIQKNRVLPGWAADPLFVLTLALMMGAPLGYFGDIPLAPLATVLIGFPLIIVSALHAGPIGRFLRLTPCTYLGDISYSLYLIHFPVQIFAYLVIRTQGIVVDFSKPVSLFVFMGSCLGLAGLSYRFLEGPAQARINTWWRQRRAS